VARVRRLSKWSSCRKGKENEGERVGRMRQGWEGVGKDRSSGKGLEEMGRGKKGKQGIGRDRKE
jgi:hypothetical protein